MNFSLFRKPSRYIGNELNMYKKEFYEQRSCVRLALCFPDVYEIGMSHLGLKILYDIVNKLPFAQAERVFSPWIDLEEYIKRNNIPLTSLESGRPLNDFDVIGFSLQYELSYTTVLNMLDLGGIPIRSDDRLNSSNPLPIVIAGGPCTVNPAPMAKFIDAFLIGDGEDAIVELMDLVRHWKLSGNKKRDTLIREIGNLEGFYVPLVHSTNYKIKKRLQLDLDQSPYPVKPVLPYMAIVHDRLNIEVSRGCTKGCRFCQAGMIYRPLRERSLERVLSIAEESLKNSGYEEVSFTSLSAGDYSCLLPAIREFNKRFGEKKIALSLPSLRVGAVSRDVLREIRSIRKTGFTMAPEAATERLRNVINKDFNEEDYEKALFALFSEGWFNLKLYFMIGLPTEKGEDIEAIPLMAMKALKIAKRVIGRFVNIGITISPFVPKPHTPFQLLGQISLDEIRYKQRFLRESLISKKFKYKGHDERMSYLEAIFSRGDESLSTLIEMAWKLGCRLDGWSELFDFDKWLDAMDKTGIDGRSYSEREFKKDEKLAWDNIDIGIEKEFLYKEYIKAISGERTEDCKKVCLACGLKCRSGSKIYTNENMREEDKVSNLRVLIQNPDSIRVRAQFSKTGRLRYLSHLEVVSVILRAISRANIKINFTKGFHPSPEVSFGPPLNVGISGEREYFDMIVFSPFDIDFYIKKLNQTMPDGIIINKMAVISKNEKSLNSFINRYEYIINLNNSFKFRDIKQITNDSILVKRDDKNLDISRFIEGIYFEDEKSIRIILRDHDKIKVRLGEVVNAIFGYSIEQLDIVRTGLYGWKDGWVEPL